MPNRKWSCFSVLATCIITGFPWFAPVRTKGVRTGSNRKRNQFPWFDWIPGRCCVLLIKHTFSAEYCLLFCRLLLYVSKMSPKRLWIFVILVMNQEISSSGKLHTLFVAKFGGYVVSITRIKYSTSFYLHNQKTALNGANQAFPWCALSLSANHWAHTKWVWMSANWFWFHGSHRVFIRTGANHGKPVNITTLMTSQWPGTQNLLPGLPEGVPIFGAPHHHWHIPEVLHKR